jgi:tetratricopeptide (TPR) repeat protein
MLKMDVGDCYRLLGLRSGASFADIKASYRRLAQQYHPDINPGDLKAKEKFITLTEAYKLLLQIVPPIEIAQKSSPPKAASKEEKVTKPHSAKQNPEPVSTATVKDKEKEKEKPQPQSKPPNIREIEQRLKWKTYEQLQLFLKERRFPQAIALAEALADRLPEDMEVRQWLAVSYQIWGRALIAQKQLLKARIYLKKALKTDPNNKTLCNEVQRDFQSLEQVF